MTRTEPPLTELYLEDEVAWLDAMVDRLRAGAYADLDYASLTEFLTDMAISERREVENRLAVLLAHILKWLYQPDRRSNSWRATIIEQRQKLNRRVGRGVLRNHALASLADCYADAVEVAAAEAGLPAEAFPAACEYTLAELLAFDPAAPGA